MTHKIQQATTSDQITNKTTVAPPRCLHYVRVAAALAGGARRPAPSTRDRSSRTEIAPKRPRHISVPVDSIGRGHWTFSEQPAAGRGPSIGHGRPVRDHRMHAMSRARCMRAHGVAQRGSIPRCRTDVSVSRAMRGVGPQRRRWVGRRRWCLCAVI
jgi:hypothetical protein